ncbi:beta-1,2-xylosyltransferase XYXT1 isoform X1 [Rosa chinensis]|uniref:beta-1,2-xylosyltransferase XYXT1 isoform X1 n=2 Tax=Rosa chinensis TaxID=74649 RepID=UPI000D08D040|nr:beta-1,2-xylosyltransferase XYXT1 isoform X1 [Rosa chinensis]
MMYDSILARSFSRHEQKKLGYGAFLCCLLIALCFCTVLKPSLNPLPPLNLQRSLGVRNKILALMESNKESNSSEHVIKTKVDRIIKTEEFKNASLIHEDEVEDSKQEQKNESITDSVTTSPISSSGDDDDQETKIVEVVTKSVEPIICNVKQPRTEYCEVNGDARVDGKSSSVIVASSQLEMSSASNSSWTIRTYARKEDPTAMSHARKWFVRPASTDDQEFPQCSRNHNVPAILFSSGGYTGNHFHDFTDVVIPLFITSRKYKGEVQFLVTDIRPFWIEKFKAVLKGLSNYQFIDIDKEQVVHCFPSITVGLIRHGKELSINDPSKYSLSMKDFRKFLRTTYSLKKVNAIRVKDGQRKKPRLLIIPRKRTRSFTNTVEIMRMAKRLGYKVSVAEASMDVAKFAELVNSCDVLMGVHGAGLTNILFLPENAVFIQILPVGGFEWLAATDFGEPSQDMNLKYLEYKISNEESTLIQQYPLDHAVFTDPYSIGKQGWEAFKSIFLDKQNVKLNVNRFKPTLLKALELLHQ